LNVRGICLVVEDDSDIRGLLCLVLSRAGFEVHAEAAGADGLEAARVLDPVLITLDVGLPDINGHEVAQRIRKFSAARILTITASPDPHHLDLRALGVDACLSKPLRPGRLVDLAQQLCPHISPIQLAPCPVMIVLEATGPDPILQPHITVEECLR
jgi:two-component system OmpR family response regulator